MCTLNTVLSLSNNLCTLRTVPSLYAQSVYSTYRPVSICSIFVLYIPYCLYLYSVQSVCYTDRTVSLSVQSVYSTYRTVSICTTCVLYRPYCLNLYNMCSLHTILLQSMLSKYHAFSI